MGECAIAPLSPHHRCSRGESIFDPPTRAVTGARSLAPRFTFFSRHSTGVGRPTLGPSLNGGKVDGRLSSIKSRLSSRFAHLSDARPTTPFPPNFTPSGRLGCIHAPLRQRQLPTNHCPGRCLTRPSWALCPKCGTCPPSVVHDPCGVRVRPPTAFRSTPGCPMHQM